MCKCVCVCVCKREKKNRKRREGVYWFVCVPCTPLQRRIFGRRKPLFINICIFTLGLALILLGIGDADVLVLVVVLVFLARELGCLAICF